ncbi:MAG: hypothetical protein ACLQDL_17230 [Spirochaetia bacterium]
MEKAQRNLADLCSRNEAFLARKAVGRPLVGIHIWDREYRRMYRETNRSIPEKGEVKPEHIDTESFLRDVGNLLRQNEKIGGDLFWPVVSYVYLPWMEAIVGCPIYASENTFYTKPCIDSWNDFHEDTDLSANRWLAKLLELQKALVDEIGGAYPLSSSSHLRGPVDMMAAALGQTRLPLECFDNPEKIQKMCAAYSRVLLDVAHMQNEISAASGFGGSTVNGYGVWTPQACQYVQDDAMAFLSPAIYSRFVFHNHVEIARGFHSVFYHLHPVSLFILDELLGIDNLAILEINREPEVMGPSIEELLPAFRKTLESNKCLLINFTQGAVGIELFEQEVARICDVLPYEGLCIYDMADDVDDGVRRMDVIRKVLEKRGAAAL